MTTAFTEARGSPLAPRRRSAGLTWTSVLLSLALLVVSILFADSRQVLSLLEGIDTRWLAAAFVVSLLQLLVLGIRYSSIAGTVGLEIGWMKGTTEYALSVLVNQVLPSGVLGDGLRAVRHARHSKHGFMRVLEAVALDRLAGHLALWLVVLATAPFGAGAELLELGPLLWAGAALAGLLGVVWLLVARLPRLQRVAGGVTRFLESGVRVLLAPGRALVHLPLSFTLIGLILLQLYIAARAVGVALSFEQLLWMGPLILLAMSLPSFFGGWGIREGASALLFAALGLPGSSGVAVALVFGAFTLIVSLPGVVVLLFDAERPAAPRTRWSQAHSLSMLAGLGLALWSRFPALLGVVATLSFLILIVQSRADWTPTGRFGAANSVTSVRLLLTTLLLLGALSWPGAWLASLALGVLLLDVVDGWLARRSSAQSEFGAQYDIEVDTVLVASLTLVLLMREQTGLWVILPPLLRYLYVLSPVFFAPLREAPSRTLSGRLAYIFMMAAFVVALVLPAEWAHALTLAGTVVVSVSFVGSFWQRYAPA